MTFKENRIPYKLLLPIFKDLTEQHQKILPLKSAWKGVDVHDLSPTSKWHDFWRLLVSASKAEKILREDGFIGCIYGMTEECPEDAPIWCTHCAKSIPETTEVD